MKKSHLLEKIKKRLTLKNIMFFWYRHYKAMFFFGFLVVFTYGSYSWYLHLYHYQWDDQQKKQFLEANFKETTFKESKFKELIKLLKDRAEAYTHKPPLTQDIFEGRKLE